VAWKLWSDGGGGVLASQYLGVCEPTDIQAVLDQSSKPVVTVFMFHNNVSYHRSHRQVKRSFPSPITATWDKDILELRRAGLGHAILMSVGLSMGIRLRRTTHGQRQLEHMPSCC
jgi:hypothetical protein